MLASPYCHYVDAHDLSCPCFDFYAVLDPYCDFSADPFDLCCDSSAGPSALCYDFSYSISGRPSDGVDRGIVTASDPSRSRRYTANEN